MKPERAQELYSDYAEGILSPALTQALEQHFDADPAARDDYARFQRVYALLEQPFAAEMEVSAGFRAHILERVALEQSRRDSALTGRAAGTVSGWFTTQPRRRALGGGLAALAAAAVLAAVVIRPAPPVGPGQNVSISGIMGIGTAPATGIDPAVIQSVSSQVGADGNSYRVFHLHLPATVPAAMVSAWTATGTTTDPSALADATPALPSRHLTSHDAAEIPIRPRETPAAGSTLNLLVQWTPDGASSPGSQVVFTPSGAANPSLSAPTNTPFLEAMQAVAAHYGVTVVVDAGTVPSQPVTADFASTDAGVPLQALAGSAGYAVQKIAPGDTFYVYRTK